MEDKFAEINKLKKLVKQVLSMYEEKKQSVNDLTEKNTMLTNEIEEKNNIINELENKTVILKTAKTISLSAEDKADVKNKINKIVREIDKSIGLLNE